MLCSHANTHAGAAQATKSVFSRIALFRFFPMEAILTLVQRLQPVLVLPQETIMQQGQSGLGLFFIIRGSVNVWRGEMLLARLKGNDYFGERSLLTENPVEASVVAETFTDLMLFDKEDVQAILRQHPDIVQQIFYFADRRASITSGEAISRRSSSQLALERVSRMSSQFQQRLRSMGCALRKQSGSSGVFDTASTPTADDLFDEDEDEDDANAECSLDERLGQANRMASRKSFRAKAGTGALTESRRSSSRRTSESRSSQMNGSNAAGSRRVSKRTTSLWGAGREPGPRDSRRCSSRRTSSIGGKVAPLTFGAGLEENKNRFNDDLASTAYLLAMSAFGLGVQTAGTKDDDSFSDGGNNPGEKPKKRASWADEGDTPLPVGARASLTNSSRRSSADVAEHTRKESVRFSVDLVV